jgi:uncharacterized protein (DUF983 family)
MNGMESECPFCGCINIIDEIDESTDNWVDCEECGENYPATDN